LSSAKETRREKEENKKKEKIKELELKKTRRECLGSFPSVLHFFWLTA
jgi:hypothetical protein